MLLRICVGQVGLVIIGEKTLLKQYTPFYRYQQTTATEGLAGLSALLKQRPVKILYRSLLTRRICDKSIHVAESTSARSQVVKQFDTG